MRTLVCLGMLFPLGVACSSSVEVFGNDGDAGGEDGTGAGASSAGGTATGGSTSSSRTTSSAGGAAQGGSSTSSSGGTGGDATGGSGQGGSGGSCAHDKCETGPALTSGCDPCVTQICNEDAFCCNQEWDEVCVAEVDEICNIECFPTGVGPCGTQYPNSPVCDDDNGECALAHDTTQQSCQELCESGGGECLEAFNDVDNLTCQIDPQQPYPCPAQQFSSVVCICSQGCGSGPACTGGQVCSGGQCI